MKSTMVDSDMPNNYQAYIRNIKRNKQKCLPSLSCRKPMSVNPFYLINKEKKKQQKCQYFQQVMLRPIKINFAFRDLVSF